MSMNRRLWIIVAISIAGIAYYVAAFGVGHASSATTRFRIMLAMLFLQALGLIALGSAIYRLLRDLRSHHLAASQVATLKGLWRSLHIGAKNGGLPLPMRETIYEAGEEAFALYEKAITLNGGPDRRQRSKGRVLTFRSRQNA